jgi:hypothetical protein
MHTFDYEIEKVSTTVILFTYSDEHGGGREGVYMYVHQLYFLAQQATNYIHGVSTLPNFFYLAPVLPISI